MNEVVETVGHVQGIAAAHASCRAAPIQPRNLEDELRRLMEEYERPIYNFLLTVVHDRDIALDCTQDTFLRAYENLAKGKPVPLSWLYTVARNRARDEFRRRKRLEPDDAALSRQRVEHATDTVLAVRGVLDRLSPGDREVLYLSDVAGFRTEEIAAMLDVRGSAIRQRLSRARARFRDLYR